MITAAVVVPQTPLLLAGVGDGIADVDAVRDASSGAVAWLLQQPVTRVLVVAGAVPSAQWSVTAAVPTPGYLGGAAPPNAMPVGLAVGLGLLGDTGGLDVGLHAVSAGDATAFGEALAAGDEATGLVVAGDGSACRTEKAPGHLDPRAEGFDARIERALAQGDAAALRGLEPDVAAQLLVAGHPAWTALAAAMPGPVAAADVDYAEAPFGVFYVVARWSA